MAMRFGERPLSPVTAKRGSATGAVRTPIVGAVPLTAFTVTPKRSGNVCAVTSYGRFGGPPGYSLRFGYCCRSSSALAYDPNGCSSGTT